MPLSNANYWKWYSIEQDSEYIFTAAHFKSSQSFGNDKSQKHYCKTSSSANAIALTEV